MSRTVWCACVRGVRIRPEREGGQVARLNVYLPDELAETMRATLPGLNVSAVFRAAIEAVLDCPHEEWACADCGSHVDRDAVVRTEVERFYREAMERVEPLVFAVGTAEGAAGALQDVARSWGVKTGPRPRPTRAERERARWNERKPA